MQPGAITNHIDVAQVVLYVFWVFFIGLIYYLHRENKREGYPLISADGQNRKIEGFPFVPSPKTFLMPGGKTITVPRAEPPQTLNAVPVGNFPGAPYQPLGNPMLSGMGPGAWANRDDHPDLTWDDQLPKIVPLRAAPEFVLAIEDPDVVGFDVAGLDGEIAGRVVDSWVDRSEYVLRYLEIELTIGGRVLIPLNFLEIKKRQRLIKTGFVTGAQFNDVPRTKHPDQVTVLEEDKIMAYYGGGMLYATASRVDPLV